MRSSLAACAVAVSFLGAGCATAPPAPPRPTVAGEPFDEAAWRVARNARIWRAAHECQRRYPSIEIVTMNEEGGLHYRYDEGNSELAQFDACLTERIETLLNGAPGRIAWGLQGSARVSVPVESRDGSLYVRGTIDGVPATLLLDTGAAKSVVKPDLARRAGLVVAADALPIRLVLSDGHMIAVQRARATSVRLGDAGVTDLDLGVYDVLPDTLEVDGLLGEDFLKFFSVTVDRSAGRLILEAAK